MKVYTTLPKSMRYQTGPWSVCEVRCSKAEIDREGGAIFHVIAEFRTREEAIACEMELREEAYAARKARKAKL